LIPSTFFFTQILRTPQWAPIVLKRGCEVAPLLPWSVDRFALMFLSKQPHSPLLAPLLGLQVVQTHMVPAESTPTLKSDLAFDTRYSKYCIMTYLILRIRSIYIILIVLFYWIRLENQVNFKSVLPNSLLVINLTNSA